MSSCSRRTNDNYDLSSPKQKSINIVVNYHQITGAILQFHSDIFWLRGKLLLWLQITLFESGIVSSIIQNMVDFFSTAQSKKLHDTIYYFSQRMPKMQKSIAGIIDYNQKTKAQIFACFEYAKLELQRGDVLSKKIRELLEREKCLQRDKKDLEDQLEGIDLLQERIQQLSRDSVCYYQMLTPTRQMECKLPISNKNISPTTKNNGNQRTGFLQLAKRILPNKDKGEDNHLRQQIQLITIFLRYGIAHAVGYLDKISHPELKQKWGKLFEKLMSEWCDFNSLPHNLKEFLNRLSSPQATNKSIDEKLRELPSKMRDAFEPVFKQVVRLKKCSVFGKEQTKPAIKSYTTAHRTRKQPNLPQKKAELQKNDGFKITKEIEQASIEQLVKDCAIANAKLQDIQAQKRKLQSFITELSKISGHHSDTRAIEEELREYEEQSKYQLQSILEKLKSTSIREYVLEEKKQEQMEEKIEEKPQEFKLKLGKNRAKIEKQTLLERRIEELQAEIIRIDFRLKEALDEKTRLAEQLATKMNLIEQLQKQAVENSKRNDYFQETIAELKRKVEQGGRKQESQPKRVRQTGKEEAEIRRLASQIQQYRRKITKMGEQRQMIIAQNKGFIEIIKAKDEKKDQLQKKFSQLSQKYAKQRGDQDKLIADLKVESSNLRKMINKSSRITAKQHLKKKEVYKKQAKSIKEVDQLGFEQISELQKIKKRCQALENELRKRDEQEIDDSKVKVDSLVKLTEDYRRQIDFLRQQLQEKDRQILQIQTKPIEQS